MTVKQLKELLAGFDDELIVISDDTGNEIMEIHLNMNDKYIAMK